MEGWVKLHRKIIDKAFYSKDSEKVHLWIHLLLKANHCDYEEMLGGKPIICKSGQFTTGRKQLSNETGICESKIERILTYFEKTEHQIEQQKTSTNRLISIINWNEYQIVEQQIEQRVNNKRTTSEQQVDTLQEDKELKKINNINIDALEISENFKEIVFVWLKYKSDRKEKYKSEESIKLFYKKLLKLSNNDSKLALRIIEQSMANNWAGIFELKDHINNQTTQPQIKQLAR